MRTLTNLDVHEELHRLVLRKRWVRWSLKHYRYGVYKMDGTGRHIAFSKRLTATKPTWEERQGEMTHEMDDQRC